MNRATNNSLSIVIPTFNRSEYLDICLGMQIPIVANSGIPIFISDNASTDSTEAVVKKWLKIYANIFYHRNSKNLGPDENFEIALSLPDTKYIWLMGDTYNIPSDLITVALEAISNKLVAYDAIIFNVESRVKDIPSKIYKSNCNLLEDIGWHMTCMSSLIFSKDLIAQANFTRYRNTNFIQMGIIFEYIAERNSAVLWICDSSVKSIARRNLFKDSWYESTFHIWLDRWPNFVLSLPPSYSISLKLKCIRDHASKSSQFTIRGLLKHKACGLLTLKSYNEYRYLFPIALTPSSRMWVLIILLIPKSILNLLKKTIRK